MDAMFFIVLGATLASFLLTLLFGCFVVFAAEHKGRSVARWIRQQVWPLRWTLYYGMAAAILFFAAFGQSAFIYQQY